MAINLKMPLSENLLRIPGVKLATLSAGLASKGHKDLMLMVFDNGSIVSGTFTQNKFCAAPVVVSKNHLRITSSIKALIVNTGSANAGTGDIGIEDAKSICQSLSASLEVSPERILPFSTGVIMTRLPVENIKKSIPNLVKGLNENNWLEAAKAIMTTDTLPKAVSKSIFIQDQKVTITGISKGAGMIHPKMATMLAFISTDAHISIEMLQKLNQEITDTTFNCISVDGDSSTNDSFITVASNKSKHSKIVQEDADYKVLKSAFFDIALELAQAIIRDGEGATKFITIKVLGGNSLKECNEIGMSIAKSPLVKTAFFASDPNLGRIFAAIGNSNLKNLDISLIDLYINEILFASEGAVAKCFDEEVIQKEMNKSEINLKVDLNNGIHKSTIWTTDLSYEYIKINAEYRT
ncbi:bifunctional glutamate N-acetyltransferase/amino-acid acetyltransferase ArgJ [Methylophilaceae bacterium]|jgi:glutamate N-acetyltransferase/amino-acid N-acetyltransferase|nr:bifunctional glutamate N-acetyltransferase/amino-acid acetyltransferase ArgJ [Methylophilaceae bacterium]|tara:strand:+ start:20589 stop:21815 length:1227 start_codon:yes stop_codon:yes gene_type:complete